MTAIDTRGEPYKDLVKALTGGSDLETACHYAGLSVSVVFMWLERGKLESERRVEGLPPSREDDAYVELWTDLKKARADAVVRNVANIQKAANSGNWQAAAWWLERTVPESYGKRTVKPEQQKQISN